MKSLELARYKTSHYLRDGQAGVIRKIKPLFSKLITDLVALPENTDEEQCLNCFQACLEKVNVFQNEITTVERETILHTIYEIGTIVGLRVDSHFAEKWRGDW